MEAHGIPRDRRAGAGAGPASRPRPALGAAGGAASDEEARDGADAAAARAGAGERDAVGLRAPAAMSTPPIPARSAPIRAATRGCSAWSRRCRTSGRSIARGSSPAASTCSAGGSRRWRACGRRISTSPAWSRRVAAGGIDEVVLAMNATLEGQTTAHYLAERLETLSRPPHPARPRPAGRRRARLSRRGHAGAGAAGAAAVARR